MTYMPDMNDKYPRNYSIDRAGIGVPVHPSPWRYQGWVRDCVEGVALHTSRTLVTLI
jgi:hypothetical protein